MYYCNIFIYNFNTITFKFLYIWCFVLWDNRMNAQMFAKLQQLALDAENYLKDARLETTKSEIPDRKIMQKISKAISILEFISKNQPKWQN